jgi:DNA repair protein RadC
MPKNFTVRDLPKTERPRERLIKLGAEALSAQELLALIIARGIPGKSVINLAQEVLSNFKNIKGVSEATIEQLCEIRGIGPAKAVQIKACFEIGKREDLEPEQKKYDIKNPGEIVKAVRALIKDKAKEHFKIIILDSRNKIIDITNISTGTLNANLAHPREIFKDAITRNAAAIILAHNHPSGDPEPSEDDLKITKQLIEAGKILGIEVLDHIIITKNSYISLKEKGLLT